MSLLKYRREIDGLRAIAVLSVIFFHAGLPAFSGGFVGVDVFFVISGYLITSIIVGDVEARRFSFRDFYERRARRILPALFLVVLCCIPFVWTLMLPMELKGFSTSVISVCLFVSNILFWRQSDYFDIDAESKPLLHTWSLSVEEQFYVIFPVAILLFSRRNRHAYVRLSIILVAVTSLLLCEYASRYHPSFNFYWLPTRAWELMAGALCVFAKISSNNSRDNILSALGILAVVASVAVYDRSTPFPSLYALAPVVGTCAVILFANNGTIVSWFLSRPPLVGLGLISYSAYLWHQPIFAFARIKSQSQQFPLEQALAFTFLSFVLAYFSWRLVEIPCRRTNSSTMRSSKMLFGIGITALVLVAFGVTGHATRGFPARWPEEVLEEVEGMSEWYRDVRKDKCHLQNFAATGRSLECFSTKSHEIVLWGDSHAASLFYGLETLAFGSPLYGITQLTAAGCPPLIGSTKLRSGCNEINRQNMAYLKAKDVDLLILAAGWLLKEYSFGMSELLNELERTIIKIKYENPNLTILLIGPLPRWKYSPHSDSVRAFLANKISAANLKGRLMLQADVLRDLDINLERLANELKISYASPAEYLCQENQCLAKLAPGSNRWTAVDYGHLSKAGSQYLVGAMWTKITEGMQTRR